ncbi:MAG: hypothetical protein CMC76_04065 [Flavobacteriaceae bacterium]|nr:hypothetical protein [Flavobacteriaceae bacterium]
MKFAFHRLNAKNIDKVKKCSILHHQNKTYFVMKKLKKAFFAIVFAIACLSTFQCSSSKDAVATRFEEPTSLKLKQAYFQEWYAGIKVGGTGINVFIPVLEEGTNVDIDSVYFRNMKAKLVKTEGKYRAILKSKSRYYTFKKDEKPEDYPFDLKDNECAISYTENGKQKFFKIRNLNEVAGTYYEEGPPSLYASNSSSILAVTDDE